VALFLKSPISCKIKKYKLEDVVYLSIVQKFGKRARGVYTPNSYVLIYWMYIIFAVVGVVFCLIPFKFWNHHDASSVALSPIEMKTMTAPIPLNKPSSPSAISVQDSPQKSPVKPPSPSSTNVQGSPLINPVKPTSPSAINVQGNPATHILNVPTPSSSLFSQIKLSPPSAISVQGSPQKNPVKPPSLSDLRNTDGSYVAAETTNAQFSSLSDLEISGLGDIKINEDVQNVVNTDVKNPLSLESENKENTTLLKINWPNPNKEWEPTMVSLLHESTNLERMLKFKAYHARFRETVPRLYDSPFLSNPDYVHYNLFGKWFFYDAHTQISKTIKPNTNEYNNIYKNKKIIYYFEMNKRFFYTTKFKYYKNRKKLNLDYQGDVKDYKSNSEEWEQIFEFP